MNRVCCISSLPVVPTEMSVVLLDVVDNKTMRTIECMYVAVTEQDIRDIMSLSGQIRRTDTGDQFYVRSVNHIGHAGNNSRIDVQDLQCNTQLVEELRKGTVID
jgi:hypothetical protein